MRQNSLKEKVYRSEPLDVVAGGKKRHTVYTVQFIRPCHHLSLQYQTLMPMLVRLQRISYQPTIIANVSLPSSYICDQDAGMNTRTSVTQPYRASSLYRSY